MKTAENLLRLLGVKSYTQRHIQIINDFFKSGEEEYRSQLTESKELPGDDKVNKQSKVSCKGNSHAMRYHHMLEQFREGAKWMRSIASPLLASKDARIRELEEANKLAEIKIAELIELNLTPTKN